MIVEYISKATWIASRISTSCARIIILKVFHVCFQKRCLAAVLAVPVELTLYSFFIHVQETFSLRVTDLRLEKNKDGLKKTTFLASKQNVQSVKSKLTVIINADLQI